MDTEEGSRPDRQVALLMLAAFVLLFVPAWFSRGPWHVDDLRYVEAARQMGEYGDWLVPRLNGDVYGEKPPGYSWSVVAVKYATGTTYLVAARIVSALAALLTGLLLVHLARVLFASRLTGWMAAGFLWTFVFVLDRGTRSLIDSFLYMWTTLGVVTLLHAALAETWRARVAWIIATVGALGYACLVKGPVGLVIPALGALVLGLSWRGRRGVCFTAIGVGALLGGLITLGWLLLAANQAGDWYLERLLFKQSAGRATQSFHHAEPIWFFLLVIPPVALPWIIFLPGAVRAAWRMRHTPAARAALGVFAWAAVILLFFSIISGKRSGYVLPLFPPLALGIAWGVMRMQTTLAGKWLGWPVKFSVYAATGAGALMCIGAVALLTVDHKRLPLDASTVALNMDGFGAGVLFSAGLITLVWGACIVSILRRRRQAWAPALILLVPLIGVMHAGLHLSVIPAIEPLKSAAPFGEAVNRDWNRDERLVVLGGQKDGLVTYYCDIRRVENYRQEELAEIQGTLWVVSFRKDWERMPADYRAGFQLRATGEFNNKDYVFLHRP
ncbi:MAG: glycosyltransferase family 39 protein [Planctomycetes bacterium]|nr:glycosyltransferase family 39 protein [Planctomycetota bacterium]